LDNTGKCQGTPGLEQKLFEITVIQQQQQQQQQQHSFAKHDENTMMEGQQDYEKLLWPPTTKKSLGENKQSEQSKSDTKEKVLDRQFGLCFNDKVSQ